MADAEAAAVRIRQMEEELNRRKMTWGEAAVLTGFAIFTLVWAALAVIGFLCLVGAE